MLQKRTTRVNLHQFPEDTYLLESSGYPGQKEMPNEKFKNLKRKADHKSIQGKNNHQSSLSKGKKKKYKFYGLKQAPRAWNSRIYEYVVSEGFTKCPYEHALYLKTNFDGDMLLVCLYVNDLIFIGNNNFMIRKFKQSMLKEF
ncbi:Integrase, catalytic core [Gossypium australe]|uniref:Integrase, catalytic core n=1 Tax=Gossypium australe TaxID=47621 RepID=A0A5B6VTG8_9ROSI|nr:Integrase, catalytic core [Gossypium australe]